MPKSSPRTASTTTQQQRAKARNTKENDALIALNQAFADHSDALLHLGWTRTAESINKCELARYKRAIAAYRRAIKENCR